MFAPKLDRTSATFDVFRVAGNRALLAAFVAGCHTDKTSDSNANANTWLDVAAGDVMSCGVRGNGRIDCWGGESLDGHYDTDSWVDYNDDEPPVGEFASVALSLGDVDPGSWHACALDEAGVATCWGRNDEDQASPPTTAFSELALGAFISCGLTIDGLVSCWGHDISSETPTNPGFSSIAAGLNVACAVNVESDVQCWVAGGSTVTYEGSWSNLAVYNHICAVGTDAALECWSSFEDYHVHYDGMPTDVGFVDVCLGWPGNGCVLTEAGAVTCWGADYTGYENYLPLAEVTLSKMSCGSFHACGLSADGAAICWGGDNGGQTDVPP